MLHGILPVSINLKKTVNEYFTIMVSMYKIYTYDDQSNKTSHIFVCQEKK